MIRFADFKDICLRLGEPVVIPNSPSKTTGFEHIYRVNNDIDLSTWLKWCYRELDKFADYDNSETNMYIRKAIQVGVVSWPLKPSEVKLRECLKQDGAEKCFLNSLNLLSSSKITKENYIRLYKNVRMMLSKDILDLLSIYQLIALNSNSNSDQKL